MLQEFKNPIPTISRPTPIDREVSWDKSKTIISETDSFGTITNVNEVFTEVSGYSTAELIGQPHNIIRHPDVPKLVYKMLWENIKKGNNFVGIVKNLAKSGEYYWVVTDFEIRKDTMGNVMNYVAKRKAVPEKSIKEQVEPLYETLLKLEKVGGMELSNRFFKNYLDKQGKDYMDFVIGLMGENEAQTISLEMDVTTETSEKIISDDIYHVNGEMNEKRKSFFERLFS